MKKHNQYGFVHLWLLLAVVLVAIAGVGYLVWERQGEDGEDAVYTAAPARDCEGEWYDTHVHLDEMEFSQSVAERMRTNKVGCSLVFSHVDVNEPDISMLELREEFAPNPGRFVLFADFIENDPKEITRQKLEQMFREAPDTFKGFGEFAYYRPPHKGTSLRAEPWPTIFQFAADKDVFVMLHVTQVEAEDLEYMLKTYPDTKVLLHHRELKADLPRLLKTYKNFYYTLDTTNLTTLVNEGGDGPPENVLLYPQGEGNAGDFLSQFNANRSKLLDQAAADWLPVFEAVPDRVFWGTDASLDWHAEPEVYEALIKFSEDFAAKLPEKYRKGYMYDNALKAFGKGITLPELSEQEFDKLDSQQDD